MGKVIPETVLIECDKCSLIMRVEEKDTKKALMNETFCHLVPDTDIEERVKMCRGKKKIPRV